MNIEFILVLVVIVLVIALSAKSRKKNQKNKSTSYNNSPATNKSKEIDYQDSNSNSITFELTIENYYDQKRQGVKSSRKQAEWFAYNKKTKVKGYEIPNGMVYVGSYLPDKYGYGNDACLIHPALNVSPAKPSEYGDQMGYYPRYEDIPPKCRGAYLQWHADGRKDPSAYIGYVFLFFYGLERRIFVDGLKSEISVGERGQIINEVRRLLDIYGENRSFKGYATRFLALEWMLFRKNEPLPDYLDLNDRYTEPFQFVLAKKVVAQEPLSSDIALTWFSLHLNYGLRTPARRCPDEFNELFHKRYRQKFGEGLIVKPNKTPLEISYHPASPSIKRIVQKEELELPDPFILTGPLNKINAIVEECTTALESYSRYIGRVGNDPASLAALSLLPPELIKSSSTLQDTKEQFSRLIATGNSEVSVKRLYEMLGETVPEKIGKKEAETLSSLLNAMGLGMAPDVNYHHVKPTPEGKVVLFDRGHGTDFEPSQEYGVFCSILRLGAMVSQIDGHVSSAEEEALANMVRDSRNLTGIEKDSLLAFLHWSLITPQGTAGIKKKLEAISKDEKTAIGHILISIAHADGRIDPKEVKQLEKLYAMLGLDKTQVLNDLHKFAAADEPVTVSYREKEESYSIPQKKETESPENVFKLNEEVIKIREAETAQVKGVLQEIFTETDEEEIELPDETVESVSPLMSLDETHRKLFEKLITKQNWEKTELHDLSKELGLMIDGALEILNEWAFENANAPLIDDGEPIYVDIELAKEIINEQ